MLNPDSTLLVDRFFDALGYLVEAKAMRGKATFAKRYGINRMNLYTLEKKRTSGYFQPCWLTYLVRDYGVSAEWLLTGKGEIKEATP